MRIKLEGKNFLFGKNVNKHDMVLEKSVIDIEVNLEMSMKLPPLTSEKRGVGREGRRASLPPLP